MRSFRNFDEDLRNWFSKSHPDGGWKRVNTKGEVVGDCARDDKDGDGKISDKEKKAAAEAMKRRRGGKPDGKGPKGKGKGPKPGKKPAKKK